MAEYLKAVREVIEALTGRVVELEDRQYTKADANNKGKMFN